MKYYRAKHQIHENFNHVTEFNFLDKKLVDYTLPKKKKNGRLWPFS